MTELENALEHLEYAREILGPLPLDVNFRFLRDLDDVIETTRELSVEQK
jgi:hypothetical protein